MEKMSFLIDGADPPFAVGTEFEIADEIAVDSLVVFERVGEGRVVIKLANMDNLPSNTVLFRAKKGNAAGQIIFEAVAPDDAMADLSGRDRLNEMLEQTFEGIAIFYRDNDLPDAIMEMYRPGLILRELGFTDASFQRGGFVGKNRFLIASAFATDLSHVGAAIPEQGLAVMQNGSYFKVLEMQERGGRKQVALLQVPAELVDFFDTDEFSPMEKQLIEIARAEFEELVDAEPVAALTDRSWLDRLTSPIGISDDGEFFARE